MVFPHPLIKGTLVQRYKRFLADVRLANGELITAYCANPGAMLTLKMAGSEVWLSPILNRKERKLQYEWQLVRVNNEFVGINTALPNLLVEEALTQQVIPELSNYSSWRREVKYGHQSRIDFLLEEPGGASCYLEVKNVNHKEGNAALFPDSKTARGAKHLRELVEVVKSGHRAVVLYVVQRQDCEVFDLASHIDPIYSASALVAKLAGIEFLCYTCAVSLSEIKIVKPLPQKEI